MYDTTTTTTATAVRRVHFTLIHSYDDACPWW